MRKTTLFVAAVGGLVLISVGTWLGVKTFAATGALAGSNQRLVPVDPAILTTHLQNLRGEIASP